MDIEDTSEDRPREPDLSEFDLESVTEFFDNKVSGQIGPTDDPEIQIIEEQGQSVETRQGQTGNPESDSLPVTTKLGAFARALENLQPGNLEAAITLKELEMDGLYKIDISGGESGKLFLKGLRCFLKQIAQIKYAPMVRRSIHPTLHDFLCSAALLPEFFCARSHPLCWPRDSALNSIIGNFDGTLRRETKAALFDASLLAKILRSDDYPRISLQLREMANGNFCRSRIALFVLAFYSAANPKTLMGKRKTRVR